MNQSQAGILQPIPRLARYLFFTVGDSSALAQTLAGFAQAVDGDSVVVGFGQSLIEQLSTNIDGLREFPTEISGDIGIPSTPYAICCWLRGSDRGEIVHHARRLIKLLAPAFDHQKTIDAFQYGPSLDLTGYEDGTENPIGEDAIEAGFVQNQGAGLDGSSFLAIQQWVHDLDLFDRLSQAAQDHAFGRRLSDNEEIDDAPKSAHVKRTAQEDFDPEAFIVRRSMPWANETQEGLVFTAFGHSFNAFEALLDRMLGKDDGIIDALFSFTNPVTGSYFWCPPMREGRLDLRLLALEGGSK